MTLKTYIFICYYPVCQNQIFVCIFFCSMSRYFDLPQRVQCTTIVPHCKTLKNSKIWVCKFDSLPFSLPSRHFLPFLLSSSPQLGYGATYLMEIFQSLSSHDFFQFNGQLTWQNVRFSRTFYKKLLNQIFKLSNIGIAISKINSDWHIRFNQISFSMLDVRGVWIIPIIQIFENLIDFEKYYQTNQLPEPFL